MFALSVLCLVFVFEKFGLSFGVFFLNNILCYDIAYCCRPSSSVNRKDKSKIPLLLRWLVCRRGRLRYEYFFSPFHGRLRLPIRKHYCRMYDIAGVVNREAGEGVPGDEMACFVQRFAFVYIALGPHHGCRHCPLSEAKIGMIRVKMLLVARNSVPFFSVFVIANGGSGIFLYEWKRRDAFFCLGQVETKRAKIGRRWNEETLGASSVCRRLFFASLCGDCLQVFFSFFFSYSREDQRRLVNCSTRSRHETLLFGTKRDKKHVRLFLVGEENAAFKSTNSIRCRANHTVMIAMIAREQDGLFSFGGRAGRRGDFLRKTRLYWLPLLL